MAGKGKQKTRPAQIRTEERQAEALRLRKRGVTFEEIAHQVGYATPSGAYEAVKSAMAKTLREPADELRQLELARLDSMLEAIIEKVLSGDLDAIGTALRISERRSRLLGLDRRETPIKTKLSKLKEPGDVVTIIGELLDKVAAGELLPSEGEKLAALLLALSRKDVELSMKNNAEITLPNMRVHFVDPVQIN